MNVDPGALTAGRLLAGPGEGAGFRIVPMERGLGESTGFLLVGIPGGRIRWVVRPERQAGADIDALYHPGLVVSRVASAVVRGAFESGLAHWLPLQRIALDPDREGALERFLSGCLGRRVRRVTVATGTPGPERKPCALVAGEDGRPAAFVKAAEGGLARSLVENEARVLRLLAGLGVPGIEIPALLWHGEWAGFSLAVSSPAPYREACGLDSPMPDAVLRLLKALRDRFGDIRPWSETKTRQALTSLVSHSGLPADWRPLVREVLRRGDAALDRVATTLSHGDLAPFNVLTDGRGCAVIDWERASDGELVGMDACHWVLAARLLRGEAAGPGILALVERPVDRLLGPGNPSRRFVLLAYLGRMGGRAAASGETGPYVDGCRRLLELALRERDDD